MLPYLEMGDGGRGGAFACFHAGKKVKSRVFTMLFKVRFSQLK